VLHLGIATKMATLNGVQHNGRYSNPVSVLGNELITYTLRAANPASSHNQSVIIRDVLPAYMKADPASVVAPDHIDSTTIPNRHILLFERQNVFSHSITTVSFRATPAPGVSASQPLFPNQAWVTTSEFDVPNPQTPTNYTYHHGAGIAMVYFSASPGGSIFGDSGQAVDYRSTALPGVIVAPDSGYYFVGWQHEAYISLRGDSIPAASGIERYEDIEIHGDVELHAVFAPELPKEFINPEDKKPLVDKIWSFQNTLYIQTENSGSIARIYTPSGILYNQRTILPSGIISIKLPAGIYIVTLNNGTGWKVAIEN
jgi:hypothetical protein